MSLFSSYYGKPKTNTYSGTRKITKPTYGGYGTPLSRDTTKTRQSFKKAGVTPTASKPKVSRSTGAGAGASGSYSGGASGSGSGGSGTTVPAVDTEAVEELTTLEEMRKEQLAAALDALAAEYDLSEGQLTAERDTFKGIFDRAVKEIGQQQNLASEATYDRMAERGLGRSGFLKTELTRADQPYQDLLAENEAKYNPEEGALGSEYARIESALKLLAQQEAAKQREIELDAEQEQYEYDKQMALLLAGMG